MALYRSRSAAVFGIEAHLIDVEVDMYPGGNARDFITVGMPDTTAIRADAKRKGTISLSIREIDREIAAVRREQLQKKRKTRTHLINLHSTDKSTFWPQQNSRSMHAGSVDR